MKISELKANPNNPRVVKDAKFAKAVNSLLCFPKMLPKRKMIIDRQGNNITLGGNVRFRAIEHIAKISSATFEELCLSAGAKEDAIAVWEQVRKTKSIPDEWVDNADEFTEEEKQRFIIADNVGFGEWEWETLANEWDAGNLEAWGLDVPGFESAQEETPEASKYTNKVDAPVYEPKNKKPEIVELYNADRYKELVQGIESSSVADDIKTLLKVSASRHIVFNYENMADFYAHSDKDVQRLMEDSALVIIDFNRAIELGFVRLNEEIAEQYQNEYGDE